MHLNNKLANGRVELIANDDGTLSYRLDGADPVPFFKEMQELLITLTVAGSRSGSIVIDKPGIVAMSIGGRTTSSGKLSLNGEVLVNGITGNVAGNNSFSYSKTVRVKKGDTIEYSCGITGSSFVYCYIAYPK